MGEAPSFVSPDEPSQDKIATAKAAVRQLAHEMARMGELEKLLEDSRARVTDLSQRVVPDALDAAGVDRVGLPELGVDVRLEPWTRAVLPKDPNARARGLGWLVSNGHGDIIKNDVSLSLGRGAHNEALSLVQELSSRFPEAKVTCREDVHHMTLTAFVREQLAKGEPVPLDDLGAAVGRVARVVKREEN